MPHLTALTVKYVIAPSMSRLVVVYTVGGVPESANYCCGTRFAKQLRTAVKRL